MATRARAHLAECARCAEEVAWLRAEREIFERRMSAMEAAPPPFSGILARTRKERSREARVRFRRIAPLLGLALAAAIAGVFATPRASETGPAETAAAPRSDFTCYDDPSSIPIEVAYAIESTGESVRFLSATDASRGTIDGAIALVEDRYAACLVATPRSVPVCAIEEPVTLDSKKPLGDEVFDSRARGESIQ
jgi:hypothetical protein